MTTYYDRSGKPISMMEWATTSKDGNRVAFDTVGDVDISTVWLGLNHSFDDGPPLIFETMIFGEEHDEDCWRYSTEEQAKAGHSLIVAAIKAGVAPPAPLTDRL
jgi:hypothetical protein